MYGGGDMGWNPAMARGRPPMLQPRGYYRGYGTPYGFRPGPLPTASRLGLSQVFSHTQSPRHLSELVLRYPRLALSDDLVKVIHHWPSFTDPIPLTVSVPFNSHPTLIIPATEEPIHEDSRHMARVMLLTSHPEELDPGVPFQHLWKRLKFLVAKRVGSWISALGGTWEAQDGVNPYDDVTLVKTAIRHCKSQAGIDLSCCTKWLKFMEFEYQRPNGAQDRTVLFVPDIWNHTANEIKVYRQMKEQEVEVEVEEEVEEEEEVDEEEKVEETAPDGTKTTKTITKKVKRKVTKKVPKKVIHKEKRIVLRSLLVSLGGLLEYVPEDILEESAEVSMFAEAFGEMIANGYGLKILNSLHDKRKADILEAEETAKRQKIEEETLALDDGPRTTRTIVEVTEEADPESLEAFQYFDIGPRPTGIIRRDALEGIVYSLGQEICEREVETLMNAVGLSRPEHSMMAPSVPYHKLAAHRTISTREVPIEEAEALDASAEGDQTNADEPPAHTDIADIEQ